MASDTSSTVATALRAPGLKLALIVAMTVAMAAPLFLIQLALDGRQSYASGAASDIAAGWGGEQTVAGPILVVPYTIVRDEVVDGRTIQSVERLTRVLLPADLGMNVTASVQERHRGIFEVPVYRSSVALRAEFDRAALLSTLPQDAKVLWGETAVVVLVGDTRGLADNVDLTVNGRKVHFEPGTLTDRGTGMHAGLAESDWTGTMRLSAEIPLRGSRSISLAPLGDRTTARIAADWGAPSFFGAFLPAARHIDVKNFEAAWTVPYLARGFGQNFDSVDPVVTDAFASSFGVRFYKPVDFYQLVDRSLKYAVLFVGLAFLVFFVMEIVAERRLHAIQYALSGAAQVLFYLLLLSLAEHVGFGWAYAVAAATTVALTAAYSASIFATWARAAVLAAVLAALYALLYVILNAEDYALLIGSGVLFVALAATMFVTRRTEWYRLAPAG